jgi:CRISPR-associated endonuclease/helicase Cas3
VEWLLWGKTGDRQADGTWPVHPLLCHMLDVEAVAQALWHEVLPAAARRGLAEGLRIEEEDAGRWVAFWAGLHDLGKVSPAFQAKHLLHTGGWPQRACLVSRARPRLPTVW